MKIIAVINNVTKIVKSDPDFNEVEYYFGSFESSIAKRICYVPIKVDELKRKRPGYLVEVLPGGQKDGYQRQGAKKRMETFARYINEHPLRYTPPVVLSGRGKWEYDEDTSTLTVYSPAAIIDGQHRVGGFVCDYEENGISRLIDFVLMNVSVAEEKRTFLDINGHAKSVPSGLVAAIENTTYYQVAELLNEDPDSMFKGKFFHSKSSALTLFNINSVTEQIEETFSHGAFDSIRGNIDVMYEIFLGYWEEIATAFSVEWEDAARKKREREYKLLELTGLIAMSRIAPEIIVPNYDAKTETVNWSGVSKLINAIADSEEMDWSKGGMFPRNGFVGASDIHRHLQSLISRIASSQKRRS
jgi:DGQHR domain-containing protein